MTDLVRVRERGSQLSRGRQWQLRVDPGFPASPFLRHQAPRAASSIGAVVSTASNRASLRHRSSVACPASTILAGALRQRFCYPG